MIGGLLRGAFVLLALAVTCPSGAHAARLPRVEELALPAERAILRELSEIFVRPIGDDGIDDALARLEPILPRLGQTRLRGAVQMSRAQMFLRRGRYEEARTAAAEAARLLPLYPEPLLVGAEAEHYGDRPVAAVDLLLQAHRRDRTILSELPDAEVHGLQARLADWNEFYRLGPLAEALFEAGWEGAPDTVSRVAFALMSWKLEAGDLRAANAQVERILVPSLYEDVLTDDKYAPVRPAALRFAGARLEKLWPVYLGKVRTDWQERRHPRSLPVYARALASAKHYHSLVATFLPLYEGALDTRDEKLPEGSVRLASALAQLGRWDEAQRVYARVVAAFASVDTSNRMNATINRASLLLDQGRTAEALVAFDAVLAEAANWPTEVGEANFVKIHVRRICALHEMGRLTDEDESWRFAWSRQDRFPGEAMAALLCRDDVAGAKRVASRMLEVETTRGEAVSLVQPFWTDPYPSDYSRKRRARAEKLRTDPELRAAASRYATLLKRPLNEAAPPDPLAPRTP